MFILSHAGLTRNPDLQVHHVHRAGKTFVAPHGLNAGILVIHLHRYRAGKYSKVLLDHWPSVELNQLGDQDLLNSYLATRPELWIELPFRFNWRSSVLWPQHRFVKSDTVVVHANAMKIHDPNWSQRHLIWFVYEWNNFRNLHCYPAPPSRVVKHMRLRIEKEIEVDRENQQ